MLYLGFLLPGAANPNLPSPIALQAGLGRSPQRLRRALAKRFLLEEMGGGVALFDFDNDGWLDIFLVNGSTFQIGEGTQTNQLSLP